MWAELQKNKIIENTMVQIKNIYLIVLRQLFFQIKNKDVMAYSPLLDIFNKMPLIYRTLFGDLYNEKEYTILYELFSNYVSDKLEHIALLKTLGTTGENMLQMIRDSNEPYTWCDNLNNMMKVILTQ
jgi:5-methylthioribose kinase